MSIVTPLFTVQVSITGESPRLDILTIVGTGPNCVAAAADGEFTVLAVCQCGHNEGDILSSRRLNNAIRLQL